MNLDDKCQEVLDFARGDVNKAQNYKTMEHFIFSKLPPGIEEDQLLQKLWFFSKLGNKESHMTEEGEMILYALIYKILCRGNRKTRSYISAIQTRYGRDKEEFAVKYYESLQANAPNAVPHGANVLLTWFALRLHNALLHCRATAETSLAFDPAESDTDNGVGLGVYGANFYSQPDSQYQSADIDSLLSGVQEHISSFFDFEDWKDTKIFRLLACMRGCHFGIEARPSHFAPEISDYNYLSKKLGIHPPGKIKALKDYRKTLIGRWMYGPESTLRRDYSGNPLIQGGFERSLVNAVACLLGQFAFESYSHCPTKLADCTERPVQRGNPA